MFKKFPNIKIEAQEKGEDKLEKKGESGKNPKRKALIEKKLGKMEKKEGSAHEKAEGKEEDGKGGCDGKGGMARDFGTGMGKVAKTAMNPIGAASNAVKAGPAVAKAGMNAVKTASGAIKDAARGFVQGSGLGAAAQKVSDFGSGNDKMTSAKAKLRKQLETMPPRATAMSAHPRAMTASSLNSPMNFKSGAKKQVGKMV